MKIDRTCDTVTAGVFFSTTRKDIKHGLVTG
jgi:hypothetical protein